MGSVRVDAFRAANPHLKVDDNDRNGQVTKSDQVTLASDPAGKPLEWNDDRFVAARTKVETGAKALDHVSTGAGIMGVVADVAASEVLLPLSAAYAVVGGLWNDDGVAGRFMNTWTAAPRAFEKMLRGTEEPPPPQQV